MPYERLESILNDCGIKHVISERSKAAFLEKAASAASLHCVIGIEAVAGLKQPSLG